jgi:hypothetical protein
MVRSSLDIYHAGTYIFLHLVLLCEAVYGYLPYHLSMYHLSILRYARLVNDVGLCADDACKCAHD